MGLVARGFSAASFTALSRPSKTPARSKVPASCSVAGGGSTAPERLDRRTDGEHDGLHPAVLGAEAYGGAVEPGDLVLTLLKFDPVGDDEPVAVRALLRGRPARACGCAACGSGRRRPGVPHRSLRERAGLTQTATAALGIEDYQLFND